MALFIKIQENSILLVGYFSLPRIKTDICKVVPKKENE